MRTGGFWPRLHDVGKPVTLKDAADNLKNYGIAAASYAAGVTLLSKAGMTAFAGGLLTAIACAFFVITLAQSWVIAQKQAQAFVPFTVNDRIRNGLKSAAKVLFYVLVPTTLAFITITSAIWFAGHQPP
ncbi:MULTISPECIES: hypothetical protein [unclassified Roseateles]|uniref:hypothetical protein n=1 Tax=unclassified Roseateles TaxID=2626991 RepID=UPI000AF328A5|nr:MULTISPECIES: hypothetical protein [unclassified Roseateles]